MLPVAAQGESQGSMPKVIWASDPTQPGQTLSVQGDGFVGGSTTVKVGRLEDVRIIEPQTAAIKPGQGDLKAVEAAELVQLNNYSLAAVIPGTLEKGELCVWIETPAGTSDVIVLNRAIPQWAENAVAVPGKALRIFGRNLNGPKVKAYISSTTNDKGKLIDVTNASDYAVTIRIPDKMDAGDYKVWIHNGYGGRFGWSEPIQIKLGTDTKGQWPTTMFDVTGYGADKTGSRDTTADIQNAINAANSNGGGIVYFPDGTYIINGTLEVFPKTQLKGQSRTGVMLKDSGNSSRRDVMIYGDTEFGIENLSIESNNCLKAVAAPKYMANQQLDIMWWFPIKTRNPQNPLPHPWPPSEERQAQYSYQGVSKDFTVNNVSIKNNLLMSQRPQGMNSSITCIANAGDNTQITNCDLVTDGNITDLFGCDYLRVYNNNFAYNKAIDCETNAQGCNHVVWEKNTLDGKSYDSNKVDASGFFFQYGCYKADNMYIADNYVHDVVGGNRGEGICFDGAPSPAAVQYLGYAGSAGANTVTADFARGYENKYPIVPMQSTWNPNYFTMNSVVIIDGKGKGQYRFITSNNADTITVDKLWDVVPDTTSVFLVEKIARDVIIVGNKIERCERAILPWGHCHNFIIADNIISGEPIRLNPNDSLPQNWGIKEKAVRYPGDSIQARTEMYNMFLNNTLYSGDISIDGNSMTVANGTIQGTLLMKPVFRGNIIKNGGSFRLLHEWDQGLQSSPEIDGVLIEQNTVESGNAGVVIENHKPDMPLNAHNTVIRENVFGTDNAVSGTAINTVLCPNYYMVKAGKTVHNMKVLGAEAKVKYDDIAGKILAIDFKNIYSLTNAQNVVFASKGNVKDMSMAFDGDKLILSQRPVWDVDIYAPGCTKVYIDDIEFKDFIKVGDVIKISGLDANGDGVINIEDMKLFVKQKKIAESHEVLAVIREACFRSAPAAPAFNAPVMSKWGTVELSWTVPKDAELYNVYRSETASGSYTMIAAAVSDNSYTDTVSVSLGKDYYYVVKAVNTLGESAYSNEVLESFKVAGISMGFDKDRIYTERTAQANILISCTNGNTYKLNETNVDVAIDYSSSDDTTAVVNSKGVVTGINSGHAVVTASLQIAGAQQTASANIAVEFPYSLITNTQWVASSAKDVLFTLEPVELALRIETSDGYVYNMKDSTRDVAITYTSSDNNVVSVNKGTIIPIAAGTAVVTAKAVINGAEYVYTKNLTVQGNKLFSDDFETYDAGIKPPWVNITANDGQHALVVADGSNKVLEIGGPNGSHIVFDKKFTAQDKRMVVAFRVKPISRHTLLQVRDNSGKIAAEFHILNDRMYLNSARITYFPRESRWYDIKLLLDTTNKKIDLYIDNQLAVSQDDYKDQSITELRKIQFAGSWDDWQNLSSDIKNYIDDVQLYGENPNPVDEEIIVASASSYAWDCVADRAVDGDNNTFWHSALNGTDNPIWWQADLGKAKYIKGFELVFLNGVSNLGERRNFKVEGSNDPSFATGVVQLAAQGGDVCQDASWKADAEDGMNAYRYIRFSKTVKEAGDAYNNIYWAMREFKITTSQTPIALPEFVLSLK